jgi:trimeric autotransporter adhesin
VQDLALHDVGMLNEWTLTVGAGPAPVVALDIAASRIPDNNPAGLSRVLQIADGAPITDLTVTVDITHPYVPDLGITLVPPNGAPITLPIGTTTSSAHLVRNWRAGDLPQLAALRGTEPAGAWTLKVVDRVRNDEGKLNRWSLELVG